MKRVLLIVALVVAGCLPAYVPHRVQLGDRAYQQGNYAEALRYYEEEAQAYPSSSLTKRMTRARGKLIEAELAVAERAFADGQVDQGMAAFAKAKAYDPAHPSIARFVGAQAGQVIKEADARAAKGAVGAAYVLAHTSAGLFDSPALAGKATALAATWADALAAKVAAATQQRRPGTAVIARAALAALDPAQVAAAEEAYAALTRQYRLGVALKGRGDAARATALVSLDDRFDAVAKGTLDRLDVTVTVGPPTDRVDVTEATLSQRIEQGTRAAPNPARVDLEQQAQNIETEMTTTREFREMENQSPSRSQGSIETYDYELEVAQGRLDQVRAELAQTPMTIEEPNYVDYAYAVETHTLVVAREVTVEVRFASGGPAVPLRQVVAVQVSDTANAAHPQLALPRKRARLPAPTALAGDLDKEIASWLAGQLRAVHTTYRDRLLAAAQDRTEGLALYLALGAGAVPAPIAHELATALDVPAVDALVAGLVAHALATVYEAPRVAAAPRVEAAAPSTPRPGSKPGPGRVTPPPTGPAPSDRPEAPAPAPDPLAAKAGYKLAIGALAYERAGVARLRVDRDGGLFNGKTQIGTWRADGTLVGRDGRLAMAIDPRGGIWSATRSAPRKLGTLSKRRIVFDDGAVVSLDRAGHVDLVNGQQHKVSVEVLVSRARSQELALLVAVTGVGLLRMQDAP
ncbi:MAG: hypothetical protein R3B06_30720 [Kofleriaceae bacterium]